MKRKILLVFGTRPEAIKMAPLVKEFAKYDANYDLRVCVTAQHRQMLDQVLDFFEIKPDYDLNLMRTNQSLNSITADILMDMKPILTDFSPDYVLVHGDTATSMAASLASYFSQCKVGHIEAGLRTWNKWAPFPEEMNRQITGRLADIHFAPTMQAKKNLISEGIISEAIVVTGNTVIDALKYSVCKINQEGYISPEIEYINRCIDLSKKTILITGHRRENFGQGFVNICMALKKIAKERSDIQIVYPVHLNPNVQNIVHSILDNIPNISLISPLSYPGFVWLMNKAQVIITDSGGIQEEAPALGKPVLVMRETTERPEAVEAGTVILVGTNINKIVAETLDLLDNEERYLKMSNIQNPYGDGKACEKIVRYFNDL